MKIIKQLLIVMTILSCISCNTVKNKSLYSSKSMISNIFNKSSMNNISSYLYVPEKDVTYCRLSVYKNNAKHENLLLDYNSNQSIEYKKIKDQYGDLLEFTITKIEYKHYFFPLWDYGYPHNIKIIVLARYANIKTEEIIEAYYLVNKKQTQIVHYMIIEK